MNRLTSHLIASIFLTLSCYSASGEDKQTAVRVMSLEGTYDRYGVVDLAVEARFKDSGIVVLRPTFIDEFLVLPKAATRDEIDTEFVIQKRGYADYLMVLPKAPVTYALVDRGGVVEMADGSLLLRKTVLIGGEGNFDAHGEEEVRISKEQNDGAEWLIVERRIKWTRRSWFQKKEMESQALIRFRKHESPSERGN